MEEIRGREVKGLVRLPKLPGELVNGERVRVTVGMFAGHTGLYQGMAPQARQRVLLTMLNGGSLPMILPAGSVEAIR